MPCPPLDFVEMRSSSSIARGGQQVQPKGRPGRARSIANGPGGTPRNPNMPAECRHKMGSSWEVFRGKPGNPGPGVKWTWEGPPSLGSDRFINWQNPRDAEYLTARVTVWAPNGPIRSTTKTWKLWP